MDQFADALHVLKIYGPAIVVIAWTYWRDWRREDRLSQRITDLEEKTHSVLLPLVEKTTATIAANTTVIERLERRLEL